jgi:hypothetical protein
MPMPSRRNSRYDKLFRRNAEQFVKDAMQLCERSLRPAASVDDVHDLASLRVDQRGATVDDDVLIPGRQCVFGKFARLEYIRYDRPDYQFKVGRTIDYDWIGFHVFSDYGFLFRRDHDSLGRRESGSSEKDGGCNRASESHLCLLG